MIRTIRAEEANVRDRTVQNICAVKIQGRIRNGCVQKILRDVRRKEMRRGDLRPANTTGNVIGAMITIRGMRADIRPAFKTSDSVVRLRIGRTALRRGRRSKAKAARRVVRGSIRVPDMGSTVRLPSPDRRGKTGAERIEGMIARRFLPTDTAAHDVRRRRFEGGKAARRVVRGREAMREITPDIRKRAFPCRKSLPRFCAWRC